MTVVVGNGHRGNTLVAVGSDVLANRPEITDLRIGRRSDLAGKTLTLLTTASYTNPSTQDAIVTYRLCGGASDQDYQLDDAFAPGETQIQFVATFDLAV